MPQHALFAHGSEMRFEPVKKIIGLMKVVKEVEESTGPESRWPYIITLEWEIGPKQGITFADAGLDIRPRVGDTLYAITYDKAKKIIDILNDQPDLPMSTIEFLANEYKE